MWVFKTKLDNDGNVLKYKARLVAKGCAQIPGVDYSETFSPVIRYSSIRFLDAISARECLRIHQMDAVSAFLKGDLIEEIYVSQPEGCCDKTNHVCQLRKSMYGLRQSSREWNHKLNSAIEKCGLVRSKVDPCVYIKPGSSQRRGEEGDRTHSVSTAGGRNIVSGAGYATRYRIHRNECESFQQLLREG